MTILNSPDHPPSLEDLLRAISRDISQRGTADLAAYARLYPALWQQLCRLFPAARFFPLGPTDTQALRHTSLADPEPARLPPTLGGYELLSVFHAGLWSTAYLARRAGQQSVALKVLTPAPMLSEPRLAQASRLARQAVGLSHPGVVAALDFGCDAGHHYQVQEFIVWPSLETWLGRHGPALPWPQAVRWLVQAAVAVQHAHDQGVVHGDLRPANLLLGEEGRLRVADFGLAGFIPPGFNDTPCLLERVLPYRSPEQASDGDLAATPASDVYALGACLYRLLTGVPPFAASTWLRLYQHIRDQPPRPLRSLAPDIPAELEAIVLQALSKQPRRRQRSAGQLARQLGRLLDG
jgi:serine/threonine-protein kinase